MPRASRGQKTGTIAYITPALMRRTRSCQIESHTTQNAHILGENISGPAKSVANARPGAYAEQSRPPDEG
eukprot:2919481-Lingulodinium_polyedra.AAC.1